MRDVPKEFKSDFLVEDGDAKVKMEKLKERIRQSGLEVYDSYSCEWGGIVDGKPMLIGLESYGARVMNNIWNAIQKFFPTEEAVLDEMTHINNLHGAFMEDRKNHFVGRSNLIKDCIKKILEVKSKSGIMVLVGKPGAGKSSLMASLVSQYVGSKQCQSAATVMTHVVGAAPGSLNITATLIRLCHEMNRQFTLQEDVPKDFKNLVMKFGNMLKEAGNACGSPFVLFIDGVDLMESANQPQNMEWLPQPIPENVVIVFTALEGDKCHQSLKRHAATEMEVIGLDMWEKADVVRNNLAEHRKILDESPFNNQLKLLVSKKEASNPLFLKLACEELRVFGVFEKISGKLKSMSHTVAALLQEILSRLEEDIGKETVCTAMALLVCARDGLHTKELHELLSLHKIMGKAKFEVADILSIQMAPESMIPHAQFAQLQRALQTFLNPTDVLNSDLRLAHFGINLAVRQRYMRGASQEFEQILHKLMAGYFYKVADPDRSKSWTGNNTRAFTELPYHLIYSGSFKMLGNVLCDLKFVYSKCQLGLAPQLLEDFQPLVLSNKFLARDHQKFLTNVTVQQYKSFVSRHLHILTNHPSLTWQQAINEPSDSPVWTSVNQLMSDCGIKKLSYMEWNTKPTHADPCQLTICDLPFAMTSVAVSEDGELIAAGGLDCIVHLYNSSTGKEIQTFRGHSDGISDVCFVGRDRLCSASHDTTASIWHVADGHRLFVLKSHTRRVNSCAANQSGNLVATASWDCTVIVWNANKGERTCFFNVGSPVNSVDFHPEGQLIVTGSWDFTIKIWDVFNKTRKAVLRGHSSSVRDVVYSPTGRHIASAALDGEVKIWSALNGSQVGNIRGHALPINKLIFSPGGKELITVSDDQKVKVWSGNLGKRTHQFGDESDGAVMCVALAPDGKSVTAGYHSGMVRQYDLVTCMTKFEVRPQEKSVRCIKYCYDGKMVYCGSDDGNVKNLNFNGNVTCTLLGHTKGVMCIDVAKQKYVATGSEDCTCCLYELGSDSGPNKNPIAVLGGHVAPVTSCTFNDDLSKIATASRDMTVRIWDLFACTIDYEPTPITVLHDCHSDWITDCKWSNTGNFMVTASNDFNLKVWDMNSFKEKTKLTGHMSSINSIAFSYGCIISSCSDGSAKVWSHKGTEITTLYGHTQRVNGCDMVVKVTESAAPEETETKDWADMVESDETKKATPPPLTADIKVHDITVATCGDDGRILIWKPIQGNEVSCLTGHSGRVLSVTSNKHGNLCTSSLDKSVKMWEVSEKEEAIESHDSEITFTITSSDGRTILSGSRDGIIKLWVMVDDRIYPKCLQTLQAHEKSVNAACFLNKSGTEFVTGSDDTTINLWCWSQNDDTIASLRMKRSYNASSPVTSLVSGSTMRGTGHVFFSAEWNGFIKVWNSNKAEMMTKSKSHSTWVLKLAFSIDDQRILMSTGADGKVVFWDVSAPLSAKDKCTIKNIHETTISSDEVDKDIPVAKRAPTHVLDATGNRQHIYAVDTKGQISSVGMENAAHTARKIHAAAVTCVISTGEIIITGSYDRTIKVWDKTLKQVGLFHAPAPVTSMAILKTKSSEGRMTIQLVCGDILGNVSFLTWNQ